MRRVATRESKCPKRRLAGPIRTSNAGAESGTAPKLTALTEWLYPGSTQAVQRAARGTDEADQADGGTRAWGSLARLVNSVRRSYGGVLMVGVLTSLGGLQLISV